MSTLFVGLGRMGGPMARRHAARHETVVSDSDPRIAAALAAELGTVAVGPGQSLDGVDTVVLMLPSSRVVESVLVEGGLLDLLAPGSLVIDMGSSEPASTRSLAERARTRGVGFVDAPVSGGVAKAETGELSIMMGGAPEDVERARPHVAPLGSTVLVVGKAGAGHAAKALNNLLSATSIAAAAEVLTVAAGFGIAPEVMVDVLNASTGRSQATEVKYPKHVLTGCYDSGFAMDLMLKDLRIAQALARGQEAVTPVIDAAFTAATQAFEALGGGPLDHTEVARHYESINRVSLRAGGGLPGQGDGTTGDRSVGETGPDRPSTDRSRTDDEEIQ